MKAIKDTAIFGKLNTVLSFKGSGMEISSDDFMIQNDIRDLSALLESSESRELDGAMVFVTKYASLRDPFDRSMQKPKLEAVEQWLISLIETLKERKIEKEMREEKIESLYQKWRSELQPKADDILTKIEELKSSLDELNKECLSRRFNEGSGTTAMRSEIKLADLFKASGVLDVKKAVDNVGVMFK